jgi:hypothetical protein
MGIGCVWGGARSSVADGDEDVAQRQGGKGIASNLNNG